MSLHSNWPICQFLAQYTLHLPDVYHGVEFCCSVRLRAKDGQSNDSKPLTLRNYISPLPSLVWAPQNNLHRLLLTDAARSRVKFCNKILPFSPIHYGSHFSELAHNSSPPGCAHEFYGGYGPSFGGYWYCRGFGRSGLGGWRLANISLDWSCDEISAPISAPFFLTRHVRQGHTSVEQYRDRRRAIDW